MWVSPLLAEHTEQLCKSRDVVTQSMEFPACNHHSIVAHLRN